VHHIIVNVSVVRYVEGLAEFWDIEEYEIEADVTCRGNTYRTLMKEFGRCYGAIPMGYRFGKRIEYADGTKGFEYATVTIIEGAKNATGFVLT